MTALPFARNVRLPGLLRIPALWRRLRARLLRFADDSRAIPAASFRSRNTVT